MAVIVYSQPAGYLLSAAASGLGTTITALNVPNYGAFQLAVPAASAIVKFQTSLDGTFWTDSYIATATTTTAIQQLSGFFPYVRGLAHLVYSGGGNTGYPSLYYRGGVK